MATHAERNDEIWQDGKQLQKFAQRALPAVNQDDKAEEARDPTAKLPECTPRLFECGHDFDCSERLDMLKNAVLKGTHFN